MNNSQNSAVRQIAERIPDAEELRERLAQNLEERDFLRRLIRVAEHKDRLEPGREASHA
ncbi:MAG: hypothetical protein HY290_08130 [Planctomycetia bacterium]|nr:hypothetical protein [Planctomycetia bacterium]